MGICVCVCLYGEKGSKIVVVVDSRMPISPPLLPSPPVPCSPSPPSPPFPSPPLPSSSIFSALRSLMLCPKRKKKGRRERKEKEKRRGRGRRGRRSRRRRRKEKKKKEKERGGKKRQLAKTPFYFSCMYVCMYVDFSKTKSQKEKKKFS